MRIKQLETLASNVIGDGKSPNLYFVSEFSKGVVMVSRDFDAAYSYWKSLPRTIETSLEDRKIGVICSTCPVADGAAKLVTYDDSQMVKA